MADDVLTEKIAVAMNESFRRQDLAEYVATGEHEGLVTVKKIDMSDGEPKFVAIDMDEIGPVLDMLAGFGMVSRPINDRTIDIDTESATALMVEAASQILLAESNTPKLVELAAAEIAGTVVQVVSAIEGTIGNSPDTKAQIIRAALVELGLGDMLRHGVGEGADPAGRVTGTRGR